MRFFLRPPDAPSRRELGAIRPVGPPDAASPERREADAPLGDGRLIRTLTMSVAEARDHLARWESEAPGHEIAAPPGVFARERSVADRRRPGPAGASAWRWRSPATRPPRRTGPSPSPRGPPTSGPGTRIVARVCDPPDAGRWSA